jgi:DNA (cytosine-5)-methyltransferase 1
MNRPVAFDFFCCAGGAGEGLRWAGFDVIGVDIQDRKNYPFNYIRGDLFKLDRRLISFGDFYWASPPCQHHSDLAKRNGNAHEWPDLIPQTRALLKSLGKPWCIENVEGAPLIDPVMLCGTMFPGLRVLRHRLFETNFPLVAPPHGAHPICHTFDKRKRQFGKTDEMRDFVQVTGGGNSSLKAASDAMGIDWMTKGEINEAIPPAYSEYIGRAALAHIASQREAA